MPKRIPIQEANLRARERRCEVPGCLSYRRTISRYCEPHRQAANRHGDPKGRLIQKAETRSQQELIDKWLKAQGEHPALAQAFAELQGLVDSAALFAAPYTIRYGDTATRLNKELRRLYGDGVTGKEIFKAVATIWLFAHQRPFDLELFSIAHRYATARRVLTLCRLERRAGRGMMGHAAELSSGVMNQLGRTLVTMLSPVMDAMAKNIDEAMTIERERHKRYIESITAHPFNSNI